MNTALEIKKKQLTTIQQFLDKAMPSLQAALPKIGLTPESLARTAFTTIVDSPHLHGADPKTLVKCIIEGAQLGLSFDKNLGHAYLVPFKGKVQLMPGYRGLIALMDRSGLVRDVVAEVVYDGDLFEYEVNMERDILRWKPITKPIDRTDDKITHAFAIIRLANGGVRHKVLDIEDLRETRARSAAYQSQGEKSPWGTDFAAMCVKTALRRVSKTTPMSPQLQKAVSLDDDVEIGRPQVLADTFLPDDVIDVLAEKAGASEPSTVDKLREKAGVKKEEPAAAPEPPAGSETEPEPAPGPVEAEVVETEPEAPAATQPQAEQPPARKRGRPRKVDAPEASGAAEPASDLPSRPAPKEKEGKEGDGDTPMTPKVRIKQILQGDVERLKKASAAILGYERDSFDDIFDREAVSMIAAITANK